MNSVRSHKVWLAALAAVVLALSGCSASVSLGGGGISQSDLERESARQLALDPEREPEVRCDGGLDNEVNATQKCQVHTAGNWVDYTATVTSVDGNNVKFNIKADDPAQVSGDAGTDSAAEPSEAPTAEAKSALEQNLNRSLQETTGSTPDDLRCAGPLDATVGAEQQCALLDGTRWLPVTVTVTGVQGDDIAFDWEVGTEAIPEPAY
ncbi:DUF4333 domain-containing protein [Gordonia caeni]|uniref:DUF4333 domain-containing protein n=1 Tax=Gordonia caeni TaxID=1007097 RepID=A0ABP7NPV0_9ACTN